MPNSQKTKLLSEIAEALKCELKDVAFLDRLRNDELKRLRELIRKAEEV